MAKLGMACPKRRDHRSNFQAFIRQARSLLCGGGRRDVKERRGSRWKTLDARSCLSHTSLCSLTFGFSVQLATRAFGSIPSGLYVWSDWIRCEGARGLSVSPRYWVQPRICRYCMDGRIPTRIWRPVVSSLKRCLDQKTCRGLGADSFARTTCSFATNNNRRLLTALVNALSPKSANCR